MDIAHFLQVQLQISDGALIDEILAASDVRAVGKGEILVRQGEQPHRLSFLMEGIFRGWLVDVNGKDITDCFEWICGAPLCPNCELNEPALITLEALTDSMVLDIPMADACEWVERFPDANRLLVHLIQRAFRRHWELKIALYQYTALQRYEWFLTAYPGLIDKISNKYIASFLNMTPVTMSRLRGSLNLSAPERPAPRNLA